MKPDYPSRWFIASIAVLLVCLVLFNIPALFPLGLLLVVTGVPFCWYKMERAFDED